MKRDEDGDDATAQVKPQVSRAGAWAAGQASFIRLVLGALAGSNGSAWGQRSWRSALVVGLGLGAGTHHASQQRSARAPVASGSAAQ